MKKILQKIGNLPNKVRTAIFGAVLFQNGAFDDEASEKEAFNRVMQCIEANFTQSVFFGMIWSKDGITHGYRFCGDFNDFRDLLCDYDYISIHQIGTRLCFGLVLDDERYKMELRRWNNGQWVNPHGAVLGDFNDKTLRVIKYFTVDFGKITTLPNEKP